MVAMLNLLLVAVAGWMPQIGTRPHTSISMAKQLRTSESSWLETLRHEMPVIGHRNWIVVADSAYPAQVSPGVTTIYTGSTQLSVVKAVLEELAHATHVYPKVAVDDELSHVPNALAPGVDKYRSDLAKLLGNRPISRIPHEQLIANLDAAGKTFRVIILKTNLTIPYTSVFFELDCAYWGPEKEKAMREKMKGSAK